MADIAALLVGAGSGLGKSMLIINTWLVLLVLEVGVEPTCSVKSAGF